MRIRMISALLASSLFSVGALAASPAVPNSYAPVVDSESFDTVRERMQAAKPEVLGRFQALLDQRYDLADRPLRGVTSGTGKPVQGGVRGKVAGGDSWGDLAS